MMTRGVDAVFIPWIVCSGAKMEPVQRRCDLLVGELARHFANHVDCFKARTMTMLSGLTLLQPQLRMTATCPMNEQDNFAATFVDISDDLLNEDPNDPLLQPHVR